MLVFSVFSQIFYVMVLGNSETATTLQKVELNFYNKTICDNIFENDSRLKNKFNEYTQVTI